MPPSPQQQQDRQAQRRLAVLRHAEEVTGNVSLTCRYYGISRNCFYKWQRRYQEEGIEGLRDRSSAPHHSSHATDADIVNKIVYLRQNYHFGPMKIRMYLQRYHDIDIACSAVYRILKRLGLNRLPASQRYKRHDKRYTGYEKQLPGNRVQIDVKFIEPIGAPAPTAQQPAPLSARRPRSAVGPSTTSSPRSTTAPGCASCGSTLGATRRQPSSSWTTSLDDYLSAARPSRPTTARSSSPPSTGTRSTRASPTPTSSRHPRTSTARWNAHTASTLKSSTAGSDAGSGDRFGHAAWKAGAVMTISNSTGVSLPRAACLRRRW